MQRVESDHGSNEALMDRLRSGDRLAEEHFYRRYALRVCRLAERKIDQRLRRRFDAEDIMQSALGSFFRRAANGEFRFDHSGALWSLLTTITVNKIRRWADFHHALKRDVSAESEVDPRHAECEAWKRGNGSREKEAVLLADAVDEALARLTARDRELFQLRYRDGLSAVEISTRTGWSVTTVNRVLYRIVGRIRWHVDRDLGP